MKHQPDWISRALAPAILGAACFGLSAGAIAQATKPAQTTTPPAATATTPATAPAVAPRAGEDDAAEFAKLDKNKDGFLDKAEAMMEPRLLAEWTKVDTNKDGKISKDEFLTFERARHAKK